jgi:hypothetical protein
MKRYIDILLWEGSAREQSSHHQYIDVAWEISHIFFASFPFRNSCPLPPLSFWPLFRSSVASRRRINRENSCPSTDMYGRGSNGKRPN